MGHYWWFDNWQGELLISIETARQTPVVMIMSSSVIIFLCSFLYKSVVRCGITLEL